MIQRFEVNKLARDYNISEEVAILIIELRQRVNSLEDRVLLLEHGPVNDNF